LVDALFLVYRCPLPNLLQNLDGEDQERANSGDGGQYDYPDQQVVFFG